MLDGELDPMYPYDPQYSCVRCDRGVDKPDERSVLQLHCYPSVKASARIQNADQQVTLCPDCQQRLVGLISELTQTTITPGMDRTDVLERCGRCKAASEPSDQLVAGRNGIIGPSHWAARLCESCAAWFRRILEGIRTEHTPYTGEWYRPPELRRAELGIETWSATATGSVSETFATLREGDLIRLVAYQSGWRSRGYYLSMTAQVEHILSPFKNGSPARVDIRTVEHELSVPPGNRQDRWKLKAEEFGPTIAYANTSLDITELLILYRADS